MKIGFLGLGKMGTRMVEKLLHDGHDVLVWNRSEEAVAKFTEKIATKHVRGELTAAPSVKEVLSRLEGPRVIWMMLPAGDATETVFQEVIPHTEENDIVVDGANAFYKDTERRYHLLKEKLLPKNPLYR